MCFVDICSQYYILQKCDARSDLILFDYINDEISRTGGTPQELLSYACAYGNWVEDKDAIRQLLQKSDNVLLSI